MDEISENKEKLKDLIAIALRIHLGFLIEYGYYNWLEGIQYLIKTKKPLSFRFSYEEWYENVSELLRLINSKSMEKFIGLYQHSKSSPTGTEAYGISDFLCGNEIVRSKDYHSKVKAVKENFDRQIEILMTLFPESKVLTDEEIH